MYSSCKIMYILQLSSTVQTHCYDPVFNLLRDNLKFIQLPIIIKHCFRNGIVYKKIISLCKNHYILIQKWRYAVNINIANGFINITQLLDYLFLFKIKQMPIFLFTIYYLQHHFLLKYQIKVEIMWNKYFCKLFFRKNKY